MSQPVVVGPPRPRWRRRLLIGVNVFVALCLVVGGASYGYLKYRFGQVPKINFRQGVLRDDGDDDPGQPMNVLIVGSDSRKDISPEERKAFGSEKQVGGERSDTIVIVRADPKEQRAAILSVPRDLYVPIAGTERSNRINTAFEKGPEQLIETITRSLGIAIDHYAEVDFNGFRGIVDAIGGVKVYFPAPARDALSGLNIRTPGCVQLDGNGALQYVRSRQYEYFESGRWRVDGTGDLGRIERQQDFIRRVIRKAAQSARNPATLNALAANAVENVTIDSAFSTRDMLRLARRFRSLSPETVEMLSLPTVDARVNGAAVLRLKQPDAQQVLDRFTGRRTAPSSEDGVPAAPSPVPPAAVRVRVLNGSGANGQATEAARELSQASFKIAGTGDADSFRYERSVIRYGGGQRAKAQLLRSYLGGRAQLREDRSLEGVDLVLVTGADFAGVRVPAAAGAGVDATTTTAPRAAEAAPERPGRGAPEVVC